MTIFDPTLGTWIGVVVGIIGIAVAYFFYKRSLVNSEISYVIDSFQLTGRHSRFPEKLKIFYGDKEIESVSQGTLIIWNSGKTTIDESLVVRDDQIMVHPAENGEILTGSVAYETRSVNKFNLLDAPNPKDVWLDFSFLDPGDGAVINLIHTGANKLTLSGTIRGIPKGFTNIHTIIGPPRMDDIFPSLWWIFMATASIVIPYAAHLDPSYKIFGTFGGGTMLITAYIGFKKMWGNRRIAIPHALYKEYLKTRKF